MPCGHRRGMKRDSRRVSPFFIGAQEVVTKFRCRPPFVSCHLEPAKDPEFWAEYFGSFVVPPPMKMTAARATELDFHARWRVETHGFLRMTMTFQRGRTICSQTFRMTGRENLSTRIPESTYPNS